MPSPVREGVFHTLIPESVPVTAIDRTYHMFPPTSCVAQRWNGHAVPRRANSRHKGRNWPSWDDTSPYSTRRSPPPPVGRVGRRSRLPGRNNSSPHLTPNSKPPRIEASAPTAIIDGLFSESIVSRRAPCPCARQSYYRRPNLLPENDASRLRRRYVVRRVIGGISSNESAAPSFAESMGRLRACAKRLPMDNSIVGRLG